MPQSEGSRQSGLRHFSALTPRRHHFRSAPISRQHGKLSGQEKFLCFTVGDDQRPESAEEDGVYVLPPAGATDPDLQAGLLTSQCVLAVKKKKNQQINKERNSSLPQSAQRSGLSGVVLVHQAGVGSLYMLVEEA